MDKLLTILLKKSEALSSLSIRLVKLTGKNQYPLHPKHLVNERIWYSNYFVKGDVVLDLGAGSCKADIKNHNKVKKIYCLDIDEKSINSAKNECKLKKINNLSFTIFNANKRLPFKDNYFDKVICSDVLEHLEKRSFALLEIKRVLKTSGITFFVTDNPDSSWKKKQKKYDLFYYADSDHKYEYPKKEILNRLKTNSFKVISIDVVTYDTPFKGFIDLVGGFSLDKYKKLRKWRKEMVKKMPDETTGYRIIAQKLQ